MAKNDFQYGGWNSYTLQCGMWLWNPDSEFTKWQHPAMWYVALGWHAIEFAQTSAISEFYIWFRFRPHHRRRHVILHQSSKFYPNGPPSAEKITSCRFSRWRMSAILDFSGPVMGSLKSRCATSYRSSMDTVALNCLVFEKIAFFCILATDRQTNKQMDITDPLSRSRCRERRLKNNKNKICWKAIWRMELLHPAVWHDHDIDFARWLHPAMWDVALGWHVMEFARTTAILEF